MIQIKRFIDKIASVEARQGKDIVLPIADARALRDEITKLVIEQKESAMPAKTDEVIEVVMRGGKW
jgi:ABC-type transporter lipoprotein component MlaA